MPKFYNQDLANLSHQLTISPRRLRVEQLRGIQTLLGLVEPDRAYPFEFVCFHITKFQKRGLTAANAIPGRALICDLVTMAEVVSRKANLAITEFAEDFETHQDLANRLKVSTKTIRRWRVRGLLGVRAVFEDGVNRLAFLRGAVDQFVAHHKALVEKGAAFRQLSNEEREGIVERARCILKGRRLKLHAVAKVIAEESGRAVETVRYTLRRYDEASSSVPLFRRDPASHGGDRGHAMWQGYESGRSTAEMAAELNCTVDEVEQSLPALQWRHWQENLPDYVYNELFDAPNAEAMILEAPEPACTDAAPTRAPRDLPAYLRSLYLTPLLTAAQEKDLFRRYNYVKFKIATRVKGQDADEINAKAVQEVREWRAVADELRRRIIQANLRLVVSIAKKHVGWTENFQEVVSDGNMSLMRAVEKFDFALGNKFSTYASWAIMKNYARSIPEDHYHCKRFVTGQEEVLDAIADHRQGQSDLGDRKQVRELLDAGLKALPEREREVLTNHFGLENQGQVQTLEQIGKKYGVTKERVRQIEQQAIAHLRSILAPSLADAIPT